MRVSDSLSRFMGLAALWLVTFGLCAFSALFFSGAVGITPIWPANAVVLAFVLRACPTPRAAAAALAVAFSAMTALNLMIGRPLVFAMAFPIANIVEISLAAWFMRRVGMPLTGMRDLGQFLLGAVTAGPLASTLISVAVMSMGLGVGGAQLVANAADWLLADMMGMAIVAPFALSMGALAGRPLLRTLAAPAAIGVITFVLCFQFVSPVVFAAFPLVALAVLRDEDWGGALGVGAVTLAICAAAAVGQGPIPRLIEFGLDPSLMIQVFLGALVLTVYPLSATLKSLELHRRELDQRRAEAETASAAKSELMGRVGEDIRSPLSGVVTVAEMLRSGRLGGLNARQRELLSRIAEAGSEIEALSHEMTAVALGAEPAGRAAPVSDIVQAALQTVRFAARRAGARIQVLPGDAAWRAAFEPERLKRIVREGLEAALAVSPKGAEVRIVVGLEGSGRLSVTIEDASQDTVLGRRDEFAQFMNAPPAESGLGLDRAELRRTGGDLTFDVGALGGGRLKILLMRVAAANDTAAA